MKRLVLTVALALGLTLPAMVQGAIPQPIYFWYSTAATISAPGQPSAREVIRPSLIFMAMDGSWAIDHLHWTGWGSSVAHATGISSASNGIPNMAQGKRITKPAQVTLSNPGLFQGREVYRCFTLTILAGPASDRHLCLQRQPGGGVWLESTQKVSTAPATPTSAPTATSAQFYAPDRHVGCLMGGSAPGGIGVYCNGSGLHAAYLGPDGHPAICNSGDCLGFAPRTSPTLAYGNQVTVGRFRCQSLRSGIQCTVVSSGKGFLINSARVTPVGP